MMTLAVDSALQTAMGALSLPGIFMGHRIISPGDEHALLPEEAAAFATSVVKVRRASGAARIVARELLAKIGLPHRALPKGRGGAPVWPNGIVGSMSHDSRIAIAAIAPSRNFSALGIDIEPAETLPPELLDLVITPQERSHIDEDPCGGRLLFAAKEAVYKAVYPLDQTFLDHHDVEVSLSRRQAVVRNGRLLKLQFCISEHLLVVAYLPAETGSEAERPV
ncbi:MAG: 4'-phosphopantetheinyl transferase superfamily protein [Xanthobacteraceae bacterium]